MDDAQALADAVLRVCPLAAAGAERARHGRAVEQRVAARNGGIAGERHRGTTCVTERRGARAFGDGAHDGRGDVLAVARGDPAGFEHDALSACDVQRQSGASTVAPSTRVASCASGARWKRRS